MLQNPVPTFDDEAALRQFLLGRLSPEVAEPLEAEMLESEELFERIQILETELFDDFVSGHLDAEDQKAFLSRYKGHAARSRLVFANTLRARTAAMKIATFRPRAARIVLAAAAIAVVAIGLAFVSMRRPELPTVTPTQTARSLEQAPIAVPPLARTISFTITLGGTRASADRDALLIPADAAHVQLGVRLHPADVYDRYAIEIRDVRDRSVLQQSDLHATAAPDRRTVQLVIPADRLPAGTYEIAVSGVNGKGPGEKLGFQSLEVRREQ